MFRVPTLRTPDLDVGMRAEAVRVELLPTAQQAYLGWRCTPVDVRPRRCLRQCGWCFRAIEVGSLAEWKGVLYYSVGVVL